MQPSPLTLLYISLEADILYMFSLITYNLITYVVHVLITNVSFVPDKRGHCSINEYIYIILFYLKFSLNTKDNQIMHKRVSWSNAKSCIDTSIFDNRHRSLNGHMSVRDSTIRRSHICIPIESSNKKNQQ